MGLGKGERSQEEEKAVHESVPESNLLFLFSPASAAVGQVSEESREINQEQRSKHLASGLWSGPTTEQHGWAGLLWPCCLSFSSTTRLTALQWRLVGSRIAIPTLPALN